MENDNALYEVFFQKQVAYYFKQLERFNNGEKYMFNVAAFFFGISWMLYRKMYLETIAFVGILFVEVLFEQLIFSVLASKVISYLIGLATGFAFGTLANFFYLQKAQRTVALAKATFSTHEERLVYVKKNGGTNTIALIIVVLCVIVLFSFIFWVNNSADY
jgi:hypothetical protein